MGVAGLPAPGDGTGAPVPSEAFEYQQLHRVGRPRVWKALVGSLLAAALGFVVLPLMLTAVLVLGVALLGRDVMDVLQELSGDEVTPLRLLSVVASLALLIPAVWLVSRLVHGLRPGWTSSVFGRMRWTYLLVCVWLAVVALATALVVGALAPSTGTDLDTSTLNEFTSRTRAYLLIVVLLVPFQAAGEEYFFRGYLTQVCGGLLARRGPARVLAVLVPAFLFALAHGPQDPPVFFDRFAFGLVAGVLVILTGGLEAAVAMHVVNNLTAFGIALAYGDMTSALSPTASSWWLLPSTLTQSLVYLVLAAWTARRMGLSNAVWGSVLVRPRGPVYGSQSKAPSA